MWHHDNVALWVCLREGMKSIWIAWSTLYLYRMLFQAWVLVSTFCLVNFTWVPLVQRFLSTLSLVNIYLSCLLFWCFGVSILPGQCLPEGLSCSSYSAIFSMVDIYRGFFYTALLVRLVNIYLSRLFVLMLWCQHFAWSIFTGRFEVCGAVTVWYSAWSIFTQLLFVFDAFAVIFGEADSANIFAWSVFTGASSMLKLLVSTFFLANIYRSRLWWCNTMEQYCWCILVFSLGISQQSVGVFRGIWSIFMLVNIYWGVFGMQDCVSKGTLVADWLGVFLGIWSIFGMQECSSGFGSL